MVRQKRINDKTAIVQMTLMNLNNEQKAILTLAAEIINEIADSTGIEDADTIWDEVWHLFMDVSGSSKNEILDKSEIASKFKEIITKEVNKNG